jgi:pantoate--beta-alanine ligase
LKIVSTIAELRSLLDAYRGAGNTVGFVPTMGALHEGHLSLIRRAKSANGVVVVSVFVNPIQFNEASDLSAYPRDLNTDAQLSSTAGADVVFAPEVSEIYPAGFQTSVVVKNVTTTLEGASRGASHFDGVTTVVAKLLNIVEPTVAYFGQKDAQQAIVVQRMVLDLAFRTRIEVSPTVREADGLAMSSRNARLDTESRARALALKAGLDAAAQAIEAGERNAATVADVAGARMATFHVTPEYFAIVSPADLAPVATIDAPVLVAVAARVGPVRLIDNAIIDPMSKSKSEAHA